MPSAPNSSVPAATVQCAAAMPRGARAPQVEACSSAATDPERCASRARRLAAICAAALLRLCRLVPDSIKGHLYWSTAVQILRALCEKHLGKIDPKWEGILRGAAYHVNQGLGVDESVMWGEYYFCEALERVLWSR